MFRSLSAEDSLTCVRNASLGNKDATFNALHHHLTESLLEKSFYSLKKHSASGLDQVSWQEYGSHLDENLEDLRLRLIQGSYRATPVKWVFIPKPDGRKRPIGIAMEDKIVQGAVKVLLEAVYDPWFAPNSYGFRPANGT